MKLLLPLLAWAGVIFGACGLGLIAFGMRKRPKDQLPIGARQRRIGLIVVGALLVLGGAYGVYDFRWPLIQMMAELGHHWAYPIVGLAVAGCVVSVLALGLRSRRLATLSLASVALMVMLALVAWRFRLSNLKAAMAGLDTMPPAKYHAMKSGLRGVKKPVDLAAVAAGQRADVAQLRALGQAEARTGIVMAGILSPMPLVLGMIGFFVGRRRPAVKSQD